MNPVAAMTPHFTIRVWGALDHHIDEMNQLLGLPRRRAPIAVIDVDQTTFDGSLTIVNHQGLEFIPQKMLST